MLRQLKIVPELNNYYRSYLIGSPLPQERLTFPIYKKSQGLYNTKNSSNLRNNNSKLRKLSINKTNYTTNNSEIFDSTGLKIVKHLKSFVAQTTEDIEIPQVKNSPTYIKNFLSTPSRKKHKIVLRKTKNTNFSLQRSPIYSFNNYNNSKSNNGLMTISGGLENEMKEKLKQIEDISVNIRILCNKINIVKNEINIGAHNKSVIDSQCINVLCNSHTIKILQKKFDIDIPKIKKEINYLYDQIFFIKKDKEMKVSLIYNYLTKIKLAQEDIGKTSFLINKTQNEMEDMKNEIFLIQDQIKNIKIALMNDNNY